MLQSSGRPPKAHPRLTWESFALAAFWRFVALLALFVVVIAVLAGSWDVALNTLRFALVILLFVACCLYILWFQHQRAELGRDHEAPRDQSKSFRTR